MPLNIYLSRRYPTRTFLDPFSSTYQTHEAPLTRRRTSSKTPFSLTMPRLSQKYNGHRRFRLTTRGFDEDAASNFDSSSTEQTIPDEPTNDGEWNRRHSESSSRSNRSSRGSSISSDTAEFSSSRRSSSMSDSTVHSSIAASDAEAPPSILAQILTTYNPLNWIRLLVTFFSFRIQRHLMHTSLEELNQQLSGVNTVLRLIMGLGSCYLLLYTVSVAVLLIPSQDVPLDSSTTLVLLGIALVASVHEIARRPSMVLEFTLIFHLVWMVLAIFAIVGVVLAILAWSGAALVVFAILTCSTVIYFLGPLLLKFPGFIWGEIKFLYSEILSLLKVFYGEFKTLVCLVRRLLSFCWAVARYLLVRAWPRLRDDVQYLLLCLWQLIRTMPNVFFIAVIFWTSTFALMKFQNTIGQSRLWIARVEQIPAIRLMLSNYWSRRFAAWMYDWVPAECRRREQWLTPDAEPNEYFYRLIGMIPSDPDYRETICRFIWAEPRPEVPEVLRDLAA